MWCDPLRVGLGGREVDRAQQHSAEDRAEQAEPGTEAGGEREPVGEGLLAVLHELPSDPGRQFLGGVQRAAEILPGGLGLVLVYSGAHSICRRYSAMPAVPTRPIPSFAMRASFLAFAHRLRDVPPWGPARLRQIPPAALAALVVPAMLRPDGQFDVTQWRLVAGVVAALVAWKTRSTALTLVVGLGLLMLLEAL